MAVRCLAGVVAGVHFELAITFTAPSCGTGAIGAMPGQTVQRRRGRVDGVASGTGHRLDRLDRRRHFSGASGPANGGMPALGGVQLCPAHRHGDPLLRSIPPPKGWPPELFACVAPPVPGDALKPAGVTPSAGTSASANDLIARQVAHGETHDHRLAVAGLERACPVGPGFAE